MKKLFYVAIVAAMGLCACKKDPRPIPAPVLNAVPPNYLSAVQKYVRQHPRFVDYDGIDFNNYRISKQKGHWYLRLALKSKLLFTDFVVLQTDSLGNTGDGRLVHLEPAPAVTRTTKTTTFTGSIDIRAVDGKAILHSGVTHGYIENFHAALVNKTGVNREESFPVPYPYDELPEVIVVAYLPAVNDGGGISFSNYVMLQSLFNGGSSSGGGINDGLGPNGVTGGSTTYSYIGGYGLSPGGSSGGGVWQPVQNQVLADVPDITVAPDNSYLRPAIDMNAWMKCFTDIPDAGASCSVTLLGDLPVDTDPSKGMNLWSGNTGHCFLQLTKTNGGQSVTQVIGFTAESPMQAIVNTEAFVPGKTVDNTGHKYDCSITMNLTADGFHTVINKMKSLSAVMPYSVVNYDCLDYGLEVFNSVRPGNPLRIPKVYSVSDPFSNIATGPKLYALLDDMLNMGSPEAGNITIGGPRHAGVSHGACN